MSENTTNNKNVRDDEIDLLDLFRRMGRTLNRLGNALGKAFLISVVFLLKRWLPLGLSIAAGIGLSYFLRTASYSSFTADMTLKSNIVENSELISYINRLHTFCSEGNSQALSDALSINPESVHNINDISAFWYIDNGGDGTPDYVDYEGHHDVYDTINVRMPDRLDIRVKIKSPQELTNVRKGIISFIKSDSLFQQQNRIRLRQNDEMHARLNYDIIQLDSLQKVKYFEETRNMQPNSGGQMIFLQEQKTQLLYTEIHELYARRQILEKENDLYKGIVTILSDFSIPARRENGGMYYGKLVIPIVFFLTLLILIILANRRKLDEIYKKY